MPPQCGFLLKKPTIIGSSCPRTAGAGTNHFGKGFCDYHQWEADHATERRSKLSQIRAARAIAAENARFFGALADIGPHEALIMEVQRTQGIVVWLEEKLRRLRDDGTPEDDILRQYTKLGIQPSVWMQLLMEERRHLVMVSAAAIKAGVAERKVKLAEDQARLIAGVMMAFIHDLELALTPAQMMAAPQIARRHLLSLSSGETLGVNPLHEVYDAEVIEE